MSRCVCVCLRERERGCAERTDALMCIANSRVLAFRLNDKDRDNEISHLLAMCELSFALALLRNKP